MATKSEPPESSDEDASTDKGESPSEGAEGSTGSAETSDSDQRLAKVQAAFDRGDYAQVRTLGAPLIAEGGPLAESASALVQRTRVDPAQVGVLVGCLLFFCFIVWKYVL